MANCYDPPGLGPNPDPTPEEDEDGDEKAPERTRQIAG